MTKRVQILGHIATIARAFIGFNREVTADTDNRELRLHDGVTPGGVAFKNVTQNDELYQAKDPELDGFLNWEPNDKGILVRLGTATYRLRNILGTAGEITVENTNGYGGNITVSLPDEITSDLTFSGSVIFTQPLYGNGGFIGSLTGNVVGNVIGDVLGNVTGNLTGNANGNHTGSFTGDVDVRGWTLQMDDGTIQLEWLSADINQTIEDAGLPVGSIVAFNGDGGSIPVNWSICDGTNGTPDLTDRFIIGAGTTYGVGSSGGAAVHNHDVMVDSGGAHSHTGTVGATALSEAQLPAHKHANGVTDSGTNLFSRGTTASAITTSDSIDNNSNNGTIEGWTSTVGSGDTHTHTLTVTSGGAHSHTGATADESNMPPYYALIYIMKVS